MSAVKISGVVITFNEEKNIARCLESLVEVAEEIVVVDSFSTDNTEAICRKHGVRFIQHPFEGHIQQKNFAMSQATFDHILSLDADEALSQDLVKSIRQAKEEWRDDAFQINRLTSYCGKWIRHCGWYPDNKIRLWDRRKGNWQGDNPHDHVVMHTGARGATLKGDILHYSYNSFSELVLQQEKFSSIAAKAAFEKNKTASFPFVVTYPFLRFLNVYFLKRGFLDGREGFVISVMDAFYRFSKYYKLYMLRRAKQ